MKGSSLSVGFWVTVGALLAIGAALLVWFAIDEAAKETSRQAKLATSEAAQKAHATTLALAKREAVRHLRDLGVASIDDSADIEENGPAVTLLGYGKPVGGGSPKLICVKWLRATFDGRTTWHLQSIDIDGERKWTGK
jgi:hypothetical protein